MKKDIAITTAVGLALTACLTIPAVATEITFVDVSSDDWYNEAVYAMTKQGLLSGTSQIIDGKGTFSPEQTVNKSDFITVVTRYLCPDDLESYRPPNSQQTSWYSPYYNVAIRHGLIKKTEFSEADMNYPMSREEMAMVLARCMSLKGFDTTIQAPASSIPDFSSITPYYAEYVRTVYKAGLITGVDEAGTFSPKTTLTRGQAAVVLHRLVNYTGKNADEVNEATLKYLEDVLNKRFSACTTEMGTFYYKHSIRERPLASDFIIETGHINGNPWNDLKYSSNFPKEVKDKTIIQLRDFQKNIYKIARDRFPNQSISGGFCDWGKTSTGNTSTITAFSWTNFKSDDGSAPFEFRWDISRDLYDFNSELIEEETITTLGELKEYLNSNMCECVTPMGTFYLEYRISKNTSDTYPWDFEILTEGKNCVLPWYDINHSIEYSLQEKQETLSILREFQKSIYEIAFRAFPDKKITGCYFSSWYKYPHTQVGYEETRNLSWTNYYHEGFIVSDYYSSYITQFHWETERDDTSFDI